MAPKSNQQLQQEVEAKDAEIAALKAQASEPAMDATDLKRQLDESKRREAELAEKIANMKIPEIIDGKTPDGILVMTPDEYAEYSKSKGLIMGRKPGQKTVCTIEELRALINSHWTPKMIMEKHGIDAEELKQLIWQLSKRELREVPIKYSIEHNYFVREG